MIIVACLIRRSEAASVRGVGVRKGKGTHLLIGDGGVGEVIVHYEVEDALEQKIAVAAEIVRAVQVAAVALCVHSALEYSDALCTHIRNQKSCSPSRLNSALRARLFAVLTHGSMSHEADGNEYTVAEIESVDI